MKAAEKRGSGAPDREAHEDRANADQGAGARAQANADPLPVNDLADAALEYARHGWGVFPCVGKKPAGLLAPHGLKDASRDPARIAEWWRQYPKGNIGATPPEGCWVLDIDLYKNATLQSLIDRLATLGTPMQRSGGGGVHVLFEGEPPSARELKAIYGDGLDIKVHAKGYVLLAPSVHPDTGIFYEWELPFTLKTAPTPAWLSSGTLPDRNDGEGHDAAADPAEPAARGLLRSNISLAKVERALRVLSADCSQELWFQRALAMELDFGEAGWPVWHEWSATDDPGKYPGEAECRNLWDRCRAMNDKLTLFSTPKTCATIIADARNLSAPAARKGPAGIVKFRMQSLKNEDVGEVEVLIPGLLTAGVSLLSGQPKLGKSWLMLMVLLNMALGNPVWNRPVAKTPSLYLALEDNKRRMKSRMAKLTHDYMLDDPDFEYVLEAPRLDEGLGDWLRGQVRDFGYKLIVIDTLAKVRPLQTKSNNVWQADYEGVQKLKAIADELNVAIVVITHNSKAGSNGFAAQNAIAATGGLMAGVDGWWVLEHTGKLTADGEPIVKLTVEHRDVEGGEFALVFDKGNAVWRMLGSFNKAAVGEVQRLILEALQRAGDAGMRLVELMSATEHPKTSVSNALIRMRKNGLVATDHSSVNRLAR